MAASWQRKSLILASLWTRLKLRAVGEGTLSPWVVHFVKGSPPLCCVGRRVNPFIWYLGVLDLIWDHSVPNMKNKQILSTPHQINISRHLLTNMWSLQFNLPHWIIKFTCIITIIIQIINISPIIQLLLHINFLYDIIMTWEVHQVFWHCYFTIFYDTTTMVWLREGRFGLITIARTGFFCLEFLLFLM